MKKWALAIASSLSMLAAPAVAQFVDPSVQGKPPTVSETQRVGSGSHIDQYGALRGWGTTRALRHDWVEAPWLINGQTFRQYINEVLILTLRLGDIVVMDNLGSHGSSTVCQARDRCSALFVAPHQRSTPC